MKSTIFYIFGPNFFRSKTHGSASLLTQTHGSASGTKKIRAFFIQKWVNYAKKIRICWNRIEDRKKSADEVNKILL
jgi:hypothetical protein